MLLDNRGACVCPYESVYIAEREKTKGHTFVWWRTFEVLFELQLKVYMILYYTVCAECLNNPVAFQNRLDKLRVVWLCHSEAKNKIVFPQFSPDSMCVVCHVWAHTHLCGSIYCIPAWGWVYLYCTRVLTYMCSYFERGCSFWVVCITLHPRELHRPPRLLQSSPWVPEKTFERWVNTVTFEAGPPPAEINTLTLV